MSNLTYRWHRHRPPVLDIAELNLASGATVFIEGPSGSGKSTLLNVLAGVVVPQSGSVTLFDRRLDRMSGSQRDRIRADAIGFIFQQFNLVPYLSVVENVMLPCRFSQRRRERSLRQSRTLESEALRLLEHLDMADLTRQKVPVVNLSVGQQQRVAAARALMGSPQLVIADEPTSSLDFRSPGSLYQTLVCRMPAGGQYGSFCQPRSHLGPSVRSHDSPERHQPGGQQAVRSIGMFIVKLALKSLWNRKFTAGLTALSIGLSVSMLLGVQRINTEAKASFTSTISGTDLIVGARTGAVQLLLYSVFHIGYATNNMSWETVLELQEHPNIDWIVPISLGDSHRGYRVMGTSRDFFDRYRFARDRQLVLSQGEVFDGVYDAVLGSDVAQQLGYDLSDEIVIAHGAGTVSLIEHDDKPFRVVGMLAPTGTPVDRTVLVSLEGIEAIHIDWREGAPPLPGQEISAELAEQIVLSPQSVTAVLVGLNSRIAAFEVQRYVNTYRAEPLLAILPGVTLQSLWDVVGVAERALSVVSGFVVVVGLSGMLVALLTSLNERRREMAILRSVGARPMHIFGLIVGEACVLTFVGITTGMVLLYGGLWIAQPIVLARFGLAIAIGALSRYELVLIAAVWGAGTAIGMVPGYLSYRQSLVDGMSVKQ